MLTRKLVKRPELASLVRRSDTSGAPVREAMHCLADAGEDVPRYSLLDILRNAQVKPILRKGNIFVFGKVGFYDAVYQTMISVYYRRGEKPPLVRTESDLQQVIHSEKNSLPIILIPAAKNQETINQLIASALEVRTPVWLVALPSKVEKQLLVAFDCFFIAAGSEEDGRAIADISSFTQDDYERLREEDDICAAIVLGKNIELGSQNRLGSVIFISSLGKH